MCDIAVKKTTFVKILTILILDVIINTSDFLTVKLVWMRGKSAEKVEQSVFLERRKKYGLFDR